MIVLFNYILSTFSVVLFIMSFGFGVVILTKQTFYLFLVFAVITLLTINFRPINKAKEISQICKTLDLDENQCRLVHNKNTEGLFELSIELKKKGACVSLKEGKFCPEEKDSFSFYKEKPLNFLLKANISTVIHKFNIQKEEVTSFKDNFFKK